MEIRQIKKSEWEKLRIFNAEEYSLSHILTNKIYYDWQFNNIFNVDRDFYETLGIFGKSGEILGTFGRFSAPYSVFGKTEMGNCLANLIVKKNLRALGYGYLLLDMASQVGGIAIDHAINDEAWKIFMKAGWHGENLRRHLYIINSKNNLYDLPAPEIIESEDSGLSFEQEKEFDFSVDEFWDRVKGRYRVSLERSAKYLNWRYTKNPLVGYHKFLAKDGKQIKAIVILRIEEVSGPTGSIGVFAGRIIDFIADSEGEFFALQKTIEFCRKNKVDFLDYFHSGDFHANVFKRAGFVDGDSAPYLSVPILFNPISFKRTRLNFAVKSDLSFELADCYTTKGGGDMDRPR